MTDNAYIDRDNLHRWRLKQNGQTVVDGAVQRAVLRFPNSASTEGDLVLDTDDADDLLTLEDNATVVQARLGHVPDFRVGLYACWLTVFDQASPNGLKWARVNVRVREWPAD